MGGGQNRVIFDSTSKITDSRIKILGQNNSIRFGNGCRISGLDILVIGDKNEVVLKDNVTINASKRQRTCLNVSGGRKIVIGRDSLLSNNVEIHTTDYHGIYGADGRRINQDADVIIGEHVWIGLRTVILKKTVIGDHCVVGANSLLSGDYSGQGCIIAGIPGRVMKQNIHWDEKRADTYSHASNPG